MATKKEVDAKKEAEFQKLYEDADECFGKLYEEGNADCGGCSNLKPCKQYFEKAQKSSESTETAEEPVKEDKKAGKKAAPAKAAEKAEPKKTTEKKAPIPPSREKDADGFVVGSKSSFMYAMIKAGKSSREDIRKAMDAKWPGANNTTTLGVFISDVQKPVGKYGSSRGIKINQNDKGIMSIEGGSKKK